MELMIEEYRWCWGRSL